MLVACFFASQSLICCFGTQGHGNKIVEVASLEIKKGFALRNSCHKHEQELYPEPKVRGIVSSSSSQGPS
eukprot:507004-Amphidinium_carterae.1